MRKHLLSHLLAGLLLLAGLGTATANATTSGTHIMVDLHFAAADGATQTVTAPLLAPSLAAIRSACASQAAMQNLAKAVVGRNPALASMTFVNGTCEHAGNGALATSAQTVPASTFGHQSDQGNPAAIVLTYRDPRGPIVKSILGTRSNPIAGAADCKAYLQRNLKALIAADRDHAGDKFLGASCIAAPAT